MNAKQAIRTALDGNHHILTMYLAGSLERHRL